MSDSLRPHGLQPTRLLCPWNSPGKNTGVGCHFLLLLEHNPIIKLEKQVKVILAFLILKKVFVAPTINCYPLLHLLLVPSLFLHMLEFPAQLTSLPSLFQLNILICLTHFRYSIYCVSVYLCNLKLLQIQVDLNNKVFMQIGLFSRQSIQDCFGIFLTKLSGIFPHTKCLLNSDRIRKSRKPVYIK